MEKTSCSQPHTKIATTDSNKRKAPEDESIYFSAGVTSAATHRQDNDLGMSFKEPEKASEYFSNTTDANTMIDNRQNYKKPRNKPPKKTPLDKSIKSAQKALDLESKIKNLSNDLKAALNPLPKGENLANSCINKDQYTNLQRTVNNIHSGFISSIKHTYTSTLPSELFEEYKIALQTLYNYHFNIVENPNMRDFKALMTKIAFVINHQNDDSKRTIFLDGFHKTITHNIAESPEYTTSNKTSFKYERTTPESINPSTDKARISKLLN